MAKWPFLAGFMTGTIRTKVQQLYSVYDSLAYRQIIYTPLSPKSRKGLWKRPEVNGAHLLTWASRCAGGRSESCFPRLIVSFYQPLILKKSFSWGAGHCPLSCYSHGGIEVETEKSPAVKGGWYLYLPTEKLEIFLFRRRIKCRKSGPSSIIGKRLIGWRWDFL